MPPNPGKHRFRQSPSFHFSSANFFFRIYFRPTKRFECVFLSGFGGDDDFWTSPADSLRFFTPDSLIIRSIRLLEPQIWSRDRRSGHGCSAEGTDAAWRAHGLGALGSQPVSDDGNKKLKSLRDFIFFVCIMFLRLGTALSNLRTHEYVISTSQNALF